MTDRPILFSAPMVRALLAGNKTQTRRIVKPDRLMVSGSHAALLNPRIRIGDRLWVRETWSHDGSGVWTIAAARSGISDGAPFYGADGHRAGAKYWPSIHMPREFSRLTLHVTDVRVERLQDISEADALAEGCVMSAPVEDIPPGPTPQASYMRLWDKINGDGAAETNPWVAAYTFTVERANIDQAGRVK